MIVNGLVWRRLIVLLVVLPIKLYSLHQKFVLFCQESGFNKKTLIFAAFAEAVAV
jgi:hypothetical protein